MLLLLLCLLLFLLLILLPLLLFILLLTLPTFALVSAAAICDWLCQLFAIVATACPSPTDFCQLLILFVDSADTIAVATAADIAFGIPPAFANVDFATDTALATAAATVLATATAFLLLLTSASFSFSFWY